MNPVRHEAPVASDFLAGAQFGEAGEVLSSMISQGRLGAAAPGELIESLRLVQKVLADDLARRDHSYRSLLMIERTIQTLRSGSPDASCPLPPVPIATPGRVRRGRLSMRAVCAQALRDLGRPATVFELQQKLAELGYCDLSRRSRASLSSNLSQNPELSCVRIDGQAYWALSSGNVEASVEPTRDVAAMGQAPETADAAADVAGAAGIEHAATDAEATEA